MSKLNIWMINHYAGNLELGMEYRHFFLARHLNRMGHQAKIISASFHHLYTEPPEMDGEILFKDVDEVPFVWLKTPHYLGNGLQRLINTLTFTWKLRRRFKDIEAKFGKPDLVFATSPHPFVVLNLLQLKKHYKIPGFFEVRDLWPLMLNELGSLSKRNPLSLLFGMLERRGYRRADCVISLWATAHEYMYQHGLTPDRFMYLPNGIELNEQGEIPSINEDHELIRDVRALKRDGKFVIGYAGSHGLANPLPSIVEACHKLQEAGVDDVLFYLVGDGPCKAETVARAEQLNLNNIRFHDYVHKDVIMAFYREIHVAKMGLRDLPLFKYGPTANKMMDYLASAKPIIFAMNTSFDPVKDHGAGISIPPDDADALYQAILDMRAKSPAELEEMGDRGLAFAREHLSFATLARKLADRAEAAVNS